VLPDEIAFALSINPSHVDRALALDEAYHLRHRVFRRDQKQHVHVNLTGRLIVPPNITLTPETRLARREAKDHIRARTDR